MRYTLYLLGCVVLAALGAVVSISSSGTALEFYRLTGLLDYATLAWLLAVCVLALLGTGSLRAFGRAFRTTFQRENPSPPPKPGRALGPGRWCPPPPCWPGAWACWPT